MASDDTRKILALKLIAALAAKLADDLERGKLWDGDYERGISRLASSLKDAS